MRRTLRLLASGFVGLHEPKGLPVLLIAVLTCLAGDFLSGRRRHTEVFPGSRLNMVVGPNGSGKSTILCAIALVLGAQAGKGGGHT